MEFLNPAGLYASSLRPLLLLPYLIKRRPRRVVFSSLLYLREFSTESSRRPWGRLRLPLIFFFQLLLLFLLVLSLGEPITSTGAPGYVAIVLDNSASMQVLEGRKTRFQIAKGEARDRIRSFSQPMEIDLFLTVPKVERVGAKLTPGEAIARIEGLEPYDLGDAGRRIGETLGRLIKENGYDRLYFMTDHPRQGNGGVIRAISVGQKQENFSIQSFRLARVSFGSAKLRAHVGVTSYSSRGQEVEVFLKGGNGKVLFRRKLDMTPGQSVETSFNGVPHQPHYEAVLKVSDPFPLDNRRFAIPPPGREMSVLGVSPRPEALYSLRSIPGLKLKVISPDNYETYQGGGYSLEVFHYSAPAVLPQNQALLILPPEQNPLVSLGRHLARPVISGWRDPHPLTRYVNFALFRPGYARSLKIGPLGEGILQSPEGPLAVASSSRGFRTLALGFDPLPYLGQENLPVSIFTLNFLHWFYEELSRSNTATGEAIEIHDLPVATNLVSPKGQEFPLKKGLTVFSRTFAQGIYRLGGAMAGKLWAVNFENAKESDLAHPNPFLVNDKSQGAEERSFHHALWPYVLLSALLLLFIEWFLNPPLAPAGGLAGSGSRSVKP
ncbi:MAG: BatA domain-containing protein [Candidatus Binatia bacterium]|nr:BatA domain-containing protein [Candidatus Binatia bacterium]